MHQILQISIIPVQGQPPAKIKLSQMAIAQNLKNVTHTIIAKMKLFVQIVKLNCHKTSPSPKKHAQLYCCILFCYF